MFNSIGKISIDNKSRFGYQDGHGGHLIGASICCATSETVTRFTIFDPMEKIERIKCILNGETPDRPAYGFWTHFPGIDLDARALSEASYAFYKNLDLDFIKSMPNGMFSIQDWGCTCDFSRIARGGVARVTDAAVKTPDDWHRLAELDLDRGAMGRELQALQGLLSLVKEEAAVIATVFSPITTAYKLSEGKIFQHLRTCPAKVAHGLDVITDTTCRFVRKVVEAEGVSVRELPGGRCVSLISKGPYGGPGHHRSYERIFEYVKQHNYVNYVRTKLTYMQSRLIQHSPIIDCYSMHGFEHSRMVNNAQRST